MRRQLQRIIFILLITIFSGRGALVLRQFYCNSAAEKAYLQAQQISDVKPAQKEYALTPGHETPLSVEKETLCSKEPPDEGLRFLMEMDLHALRGINADVLGWIHIPDTQISYPLLQTEDNQTYLNKTWEGSNNGVGSIYLECKSKQDFSDFNTSSVVESALVQTTADTILTLSTCTGTGTYHSRWVVQAVLTDRWSR